jgi:hypothetical protein
LFGRPYEAVCGFRNLLGQSEHVHQTHVVIGKRLARLMGIPFEQEAGREPRKRYMLPSDTIVGLKDAKKLGILDERDLFGGVVAQPFIATKAITHSLIEPGAAAPEGWSHDFGTATADAVLKGFAAFSLVDARKAGSRLLRDGPVRVKQTSGQGGGGQVLAFDRAALERALAEIDTDEIESTGVVLEEHLPEVTTFSVGVVRGADVTIGYCGTQRLTEDNQGRTVYGGSVLDVVRGDWDALLASPLSDQERRAVMSARRYDEAATACFPGFFASRRNYDVALGINGGRRPTCGVLEQSWRLGGATPAEVLAMEALKSDPSIARLRASIAEIYGPVGELPPGATLFFSGEDAEVGPITKCAWLEDGSS